MADLQLQMTLTLADAASGPLRGFAEGLEKLKASTTGVAKQLESIAVGITSIGTAVAASSGVQTFAERLGGLSAAMKTTKEASAGVASSIRSIGQRASASGTGVYALEQAMGALGGTLSGVAARLEAAIVGLGGLGAEARAAGAGVRAGAREMGEGIGGVNDQAIDLTRTIKGIAALWGAMKIEKGLKTAVENAGETQATENRLKNLQLSPDDSAALNGSIANVRNTFPHFNKNEITEMAIDLHTATGSATEAAAGLENFAKAILAINASLPSGQTLDAQGKIALGKILEARGATTEGPARMAEVTEQIVKGVAMSQGRVNPNNIFGNISMEKGGLGRTMDDQAFKELMVSIEQDSRGGGSNGGSQGNMWSQLVAAITKGRAITTKNRDDWLKLGMVDPDKVNINPNTNNVTSVQAGAIAGSDVITKNWRKWVIEYLGAAIEKSGVDMSDLGKLKEKVDVLLPNANAAEGAFQILSRRELYKKDLDVYEKTAGLDPQVANAVGLFKQQASDAGKAVYDLGESIGKALLPVLGPMIKGFTAAVLWLRQLVDNHPAVGLILGIAGAFATAALGLAAFTLLFGPIMPLLTVVGGAFVTLSGLIVTAFRAILGAMGPAGLLITVITVAWQLGLGDWLASINVFGHTMGDWANRLADTVGNAFERMWIRTKKFFGLVSEDAANAELEAVGRRKGDGGASGGWGKESSVDFGAGGDWGGEPSEIEKLLAKNKAGSADMLGKHTKGKKGRFAHYDEELDAAKNAYRLAEDEDKRQDEIQKRRYAANLISIDAFYDEKLAKLQGSVNNEVAILEQEKARYLTPGSDGKIDKAGAARVQTDITLKQRSLASGIDDIGIERQQDKKKLADDIDRKSLDLQREMMAVSGRRHEAEMLHLQEEAAAKIKALELDRVRAGGDPVMNAKIDADIRTQQAINTKAEAAMKYAHVMEDVNMREEEAKRKQQEVQDDLQHGLITQSEAEQRDYAIRQQLSAQLDELLPKLREYADLTGDPKAQKEVRALSTRVSKGKAEGDPTAVLFDTTMSKAAQQGAQDFFKNIIDGSMGANKAIANFGQSLRNTFMNLISQKLGDALFKSLFGNMFGAGGGGSGSGLFGLIGGGLSSLLGMGGGGGSYSGLVTEGGYGGTGQIDRQFPGLAIGTDYVPRDMLAMIHKGERVMPARDNAAFSAAAAMRGSGGGAPSSLHVSFDDSMRNTRVIDLLDAHISREMAAR